MDFNSREIKPQTATPSTHAAAPSGRKSSDKGKWGRVGFVAAIGALVVLLISLIVLAASGGTKAKESEYVDSSKLQAIFLNTGQVYFGKVQTLNDDFFVLANIYYLQTSNAGSGANATANSNVTLVKLGCELHKPLDKMVINRDQVTFWENLDAKGQVATAVTKFQDENPDGQKCADQSSSAGTDSTTNTQNAGNNSTTPTTTPTTNNTTTNNNR